MSRLTSSTTDSAWAESNCTCVTRWQDGQVTRGVRRSRSIECRVVLPHPLHFTGTSIALKSMTIVDLPYSSSPPFATGAVDEIREFGWNLRRESDTFSHWP